MDRLIEIGGIGIRLAVADEFGDALLSKAYDLFLRPTDSDVTVSGTLHVDAFRTVGGFDLDDLGEVVATGCNDLGESHLYFNGSNYTVGISPMPGMEMRCMEFAPDFSSATLRLVPGDRWNGFILDSMLRIFFSQVAVKSSAFLIHASVVTTPGGAHLFLGSSGTGKSTHSSLWLSNIPDAELLNDDNPLIKVGGDGKIYAAGTPWSGKTRCWRDMEAPLRSMTRLRQGAVNSYTELSDIEAFVAVMPGVSVIAHSRKLYGSVCATLGHVVENVRIGLLDCLPDDSAALLCHDNVSR